MNRVNQGTATAFAEVLTNSGISYYQNRTSGAENKDRLMIYFQGMKLYVPDGVSHETLLMTLQTMKQL